MKAMIFAPYADRLQLQVRILPGSHGTRAGSSANEEEARDASTEEPDPSTADRRPGRRDTRLRCLSDARALTHRSDAAAAHSRAGSHWRAGHGVANRDRGARANNADADADADPDPAGRDAKPHTCSTANRGVSPSSDAADDAAPRPYRTAGHARRRASAACDSGAARR